MTRVDTAVELPQAPAAAKRPRQGLRLVFGLSVVVLGAAALRLPYLSGSLPALVHPDERIVVERGLAALDGRLAPAVFDWPPASGYLYAGAVLAVRTIRPAVTAEAGSRYLLARLLFVAVALAAVALTGLLGARLADRRRQRLLTGLGAAAVLAVSYTSVRLSRIAHPEHLQMVFMLLSVLCALAFDRRRRLWPLAAAGVFAGLAGATKYVGITVVAIPLLAVLVWPIRARRKLVQLAALASTTALGFVGGTAGTVLRPGFLDGIAWQLRHQGGGYLGYEAGEAGWLFHLTRTLPGDWGWPVTVVAVIGVGAVLRRGTRAQRLVACYVLLLFGLIGASQVRFPHYALILEPLLAALALVAVARIRPPSAQIMGIAAIVLSLGVVALDDIRLLRTDGAVNTRLLADEAVAEIPAPVWSEAYTLTSPREHEVPAFGTAPEVLSCDCIAVISSYQEQRFRRLPQRYAAEIAVYDALRSQGEILLEIIPAGPLSYRWDQLPEYGVRSLPLTGPVGPVGPVITIVDLRR